MVAPPTNPSSELFTGDTASAVATFNAHGGPHWRSGEPGQTASSGRFTTTAQPTHQPAARHRYRKGTINTVFLPLTPQTTPPRHHSTRIPPNHQPTTLPAQIHGLSLLSARHRVCLVLSAPLVLPPAQNAEELSATAYLPHHPNTQQASPSAFASKMPATGRSCNRCSILACGMPPPYSTIRHTLITRATRLQASNPTPTTQLAAAQLHNMPPPTT
jgi:hypothetical protein